MILDGQNTILFGINKSPPLSARVPPQVLHRKIIPENIVEILVDPLSLLVWYYDDGSKRLDCDGARIGTHSWTETENLLLQNCLLKVFNLKVDVVRAGLSKRDRLQYFTISFPAKSFREFRALMRENFICNQTLDQIPSMLYKFWTPRND